MRLPKIDYLIFGSYSSRAAAKSAAGIGVPELSTAHNRAKAVFLCVLHGYIQVMVSRAGASQDAPVSVEAGYANPVRFTTSQIGVCGGDCPNHSTEAAIMATIPTQTHPEYTYRSKTNLAHHALLTSALLDAICYLAASGDTCAQKHITDLCVIASERADQLAEEIEISEVRA